MALTREQFQELRDDGLSVDQIIRFERGETPETITADRERELRLSRRGTEGGVIGDIGRAIFKPAVSLALRPVQLGKALLGKEQDLNLPFFGEIKAPRNKSDIVRDLGRGLETISLGVGGTGAVRAISGGLRGSIARAIGKGALVGAGAGLLSGAGQRAVQEGEDVTAGSLAGGGAIGASIGGAGGAILGGLGVGFAKGLRAGGRVVGRARGNPAILVQDAIEITRPVLMKGERIAAIKSGRAVETGLPGFKQVKILKPSARDKEVAKTVEGIVSKKNNTLQNISQVGDEVSKIDNGITGFLGQNNSIFKTKELTNSLNVAKEKSRVIFAGDKTLESRYDAIIDEMVRLTDKKDLSSLFEARKQFDSIVRAKFPRTFTGDATDNVTRNAILDVRREVNEFIARKLPEGNAFKAQLRQEHLMLEAIENIAEQAEQLVKTARGRSALNTVIALIAGGAIATVGSFFVGRGLSAATGDF